MPRHLELPPQPNLFVSTSNFNNQVRNIRYNAFDPYAYTQGRWLDKDRERREARQLDFNFEALVDIAINSSDGAHRLVARLPNHLAGPPRLTVSSETATLQYVREKTTVPVPKVLAWSVDSKTNSVGAEYMVMEAANGVPLSSVWNQMTGSQHIACIESIGKLAKQLCSLEFADFGSLYFDGPDRPAGAISHDERYCIGPHCARQHWGYGHKKDARSTMLEGCQGSWRDIAAYSSDLAQLARSTIQARGSTESDNNHLQLLDIYQSTVEAIRSLESFRNISKPLLFHPDLHIRNIFVHESDHTMVTSIIDWQAAAIEPSFVNTAETPDIAQLLTLDKTLDATLDAETKNARTDAERCATTWIVMRHLCPKLGEAALVLDPLARDVIVDSDFENSDERKSSAAALCRFLTAASSGWLDDPVCIRSVLADLGGQWHDLGLPGTSLYQPTQADTEALSVQLDEFESTQRLREYLSRLLGCDHDGWVSAERWDEVLPVYREQYEKFVESCVASKEQHETEAAALEKAQRLWPFDMR
ncbi:hypothetical protein QM012_002609 [Aureobasidium pullulans]|uniref:Altered inheritance of mitochondria protein 9, mitochondrial n=1 Tax=Aureobasidium pullulans TaxID=5580 RepID=A0ABR0TA15_AURPU